MAVELAKHQLEAVSKLSNGKILCGGVGTGKSTTAIAYFFTQECGGELKKNGEFGEMQTPKDLYIITTARKRDTLDWEGECAQYMLSTDPSISFGGVKVTVDSWNNIKKYVDVTGAFFIFDEQRLIGSGVWVKSFYKIVAANRWILLSATPGDTWADYIPVFVANGLYKNKTDFTRQHAVYSRYTKYPKIDRYVEQARLIRYKKSLLVDMPYVRTTVSNREIIPVSYNKEHFDLALKKRWSIFTDSPIKDVSELFRTMRQIVNTDQSRLDAVVELFKQHPKLIIFYNFNYELEMLRGLRDALGVEVAEWNGHNHEMIPEGDKWLYLVQYTAGAEGWNCITTDTIVFFSLNYSYRVMHQAEGRINRMNTPYTDLYYFTLRSSSKIDLAVWKTLKQKKNFNESSFVSHGR